MATGLSVVNPAQLANSSAPAFVHLEGISADNGGIDPHGAVQIPAGTRRITLTFSGGSLGDPTRVLFRYQLAGYDPDWSAATTAREASYTNVGPGSYRFRVSALNASGKWNETGAYLDFSVAPRYYQTAWFQLLSLAAGLGMLAALYRLRLRQVAHQFNLRMEERVHERTRIARDLHDTLLQSFNGVVLKFSAVKYMMRDRPAEADGMLQGAIEEARQAIIEGRDAVQGLRSSTVQTNDLARAITTFGEGLVSKQDGQQPFDFRVQVEGTSRDLPPLMRDEVYRIAGEALRNAFRHSSARRIEVTIHYEKRQLRMRVRDDGKGIDSQTLEAGGRTGHHGLPGMRERAEIVGGKLAVWSELNSGTEIELTIPASLAYAKSPDARNSQPING
jgi:signal transduction histidine kinase